MFLLPMVDDRSINGFNLQRVIILCSCEKKSLGDKSPRSTSAQTLIRENRYLKLVPSISLLQLCANDNHERSVSKLKLKFTLWNDLFYGKMNAACDLSSLSLA